MKIATLRSLPVLPLLLSLACSLITDETQAPVGIKLLVSPTALTVTDTLHLSLSNATNATAGYNLCFAFVSLDRRGATGWVPVSLEPSGTVCTLELLALLPGDTARGVLALQSSMLSGTYRARIRIEWPVNGGQREVASEQVTVLP